jgi:ABC-2 type transport system ATP-binding protein
MPGVRSLSMRAERAATHPAVTGAGHRHLALVGSAARPAELLLHGVCKRWGKRGTAVLSGVDLELGAGTSVAITGRNGAGKTTLLRVAAGLIAPDAGSISVGGLDVVRNRREYHERLGLMSAASAGLYARLSARRHVDLAARMALMAPRDRARRVAETLERFELDEFGDRRVDRLSMGQRQRVRLAMTFVHEPRLLLLDEPGNSLDEEGLALLASAMRRSLDQGGAAVWVGPTGAQWDFPFDRSYLLESGFLTQQQPEDHQ